MYCMWLTPLKLCSKLKACNFTRRPASCLMKNSSYSLCSLSPTAVSLLCHAPSPKLQGPSKLIAGCEVPVFAICPIARGSFFLSSLSGLPYHHIIHLTSLIAAVKLFNWAEIPFPIRGIFWVLGLFHCHVRCAIALTDNLLLFKAQLDARRGCLIEVPQDLTEVRIRSESIFSASFKAKAFSPFLPTFFIPKWYSFTNTVQSSDVAFYTTAVIGFTNPITAVYGRNNSHTDLSFSSFFHFSSSTSQSLRLLGDR